MKIKTVGEAFKALEKFKDETGLCYYEIESLAKKMNKRILEGEDQ